MLQYNSSRIRHCVTSGAAGSPVLLGTVLAGKNHRVAPGASRSEFSQVISAQHLSNQPFRGAKRGSAKLGNCSGQRQESFFSSQLKHAKRAGNRQTKLLGNRTSISLIHEQNVGVALLGQRNCFRLAGTESAEGDECRWGDDL